MASLLVSTIVPGSLQDLISYSIIFLFSYFFIFFYRLIFLFSYFVAISAHSQGGIEDEDDEDDENVARRVQREMAGLRPSRVRMTSSTLEC